MVASIAEISSSARTVAYYARDGNYSADDPEHTRASGWHGQLAAEFGLKGVVEAKPFARILAGYVPGTGKRLGRIRGGVHRHRAGLDVVLSAPKSVSLQGLLHEDHRVVHVHDAAVLRTVQWIENSLLDTRKWDPATRTRPRIRAQGMLAASFRHVCSRNLDPQIHTHCIIANLTRTGDGNWQTIEPASLRRHVKLIGAFYRNELAAGLRLLDYTIEPVMIGTIPGFEIAGHEPATLRIFSSRRRDILRFLRQRGVAVTARALQHAAIVTRPPKVVQPLEELLPKWRNRMQLSGTTMVHKPERTGPHHTATGSPERRPHEIVWRAMDELSKHNCVISGSELRAMSLGCTPGRHPLHEIDNAMHRLSRTGHLVPSVRRSTDQAFMTDTQANAQAVIVDWMKRGRGRCTSLHPSGTFGLSAEDEYRQATERMVAAGDRLIGVRYQETAQRDELLRRFIGMIGNRPYLCLAPSAKSARHHATCIGLQTLSFDSLLRDTASFLQSRHAEKHKSGVIMLLDAADVGHHDLSILFHLADRLAAPRVLLVDDEKSVRRSSPSQSFRTLLEAGMQTALLESPGLRPEPENRLSVVETGYHNLVRDVVERWSALPRDQRQTTGISAPTRTLRAELDEAITELRKSDETPGHNGLQISRLMNRHMSQRQLRDPANYHAGDVAIVTRPVGKFRAGDHLDVLSTENDKVVLREKDGTTQVMSIDATLAQSVVIHACERIRLHNGDRVVRTEPDSSGLPALFTESSATIIDMDEREVRVLTRSAKEVRASRDDVRLRHLAPVWSLPESGVPTRVVSRLLIVHDSGVESERHAIVDRMLQEGKTVEIVTDSHTDACEYLLRRSNVDDLFQAAVSRNLRDDNQNSWQRLVQQSRDTGVSPLRVADYDSTVARVLTTGSEPVNESLVEEVEQTNRRWLQYHRDTERFVAQRAEQQKCASFGTDLTRTFTRNLNVEPAAHDLIGKLNDDVHPGARSLEAVLLRAVGQRTPTDMFTNREPEKPHGHLTNRERDQEARDRQIGNFSDEANSLISGDAVHTVNRIRDLVQEGRSILQQDSRSEICLTPDERLTIRSQLRRLEIRCTMLSRQQMQRNKGLKIH